MGWFFGFKLHLIYNECGELLNFMITPGDIDDRKPLEYKSFVEFIYGKLVGDKGYISMVLFQRLFVDGIQLITKLKSNMKGALMSLSDKLLLRKRAIIETVNDELKNIAQVEHSRHRTFDNFIVNLLGAIAAYCCFPKKPCINVSRTIDTQPYFKFVELTLFITAKSYRRSSRNGSRATTHTHKSVSSFPSQKRKSTESTYSWVGGSWSRYQVQS